MFLWAGNDTQKWYKLEKGEIAGDAPKPKLPEGEAVGRFVEMGWFDESVALIKWRFNANRLKKLANDYNLYGSQGILGYYPHKIQEWYRKMKKADFDFTKTENRIGVYFHNGIYTVNGGHHRVVAALALLDETGDATVINKLLENAGITGTAPPPSIKVPLYTIDDSILKEVVSDIDIPKPKNWIERNDK